MSIQCAKEKLNDLFQQWCNHTIDENHIPLLMSLLQNADEKGQLEKLMEDAFAQSHEKFFSDEEKRKIFTLCIGTSLKNTDE